MLLNYKKAYDLVSLKWEDVLLSICRSQLGYNSIHEWRAAGLLAGAKFFASFCSSPGCDTAISCIFIPG